MNFIKRALKRRKVKKFIDKMNLSVIKHFPIDDGIRYSSSCVKFDSMFDGKFDRSILRKRRIVFNFGEYSLVAADILEYTGRDKQNKEKSFLIKIIQYDMEKQLERLLGYNYFHLLDLEDNIYKDELILFETSKCFFKFVNMSKKVKNLDTHLTYDYFSTIMDRIVRKDKPYFSYTEKEGINLWRKEMTKINEKAVKIPLKSIDMVVETYRFIK